jgi:hypothetical protein
MFYCRDYRNCLKHPKVLGFSGWAAGQIERKHTVSEFSLSVEVMGTPLGLILSFLQGKHATKKAPRSIIYVKARLIISKFPYFGPWKPNKSTNQDEPIT